MCEDSAKRKMISVSPLANRGTEVMKRYCTAAGDSTLVLEKIVQTFLYVSVNRRSSFESRSKVDSKVIRMIVYFFLSSLLNEDAVRNLQLALDLDERKSFRYPGIRVENKEKIGIHSRNRWQNFVVQS